MPWRETRDPYAILVSEVMLQQTQVQTVIPYYLRFLARFPTAAALAAADEQELLVHWQGLGYYRRARNLQAAAAQITTEHQGLIPPDKTAIDSLRGVGPYTSAAVASIAFNLPFACVDGNVVRVISRLDACDANVTDLKQQKRLAARAQVLLDPRRPGDFNQAMMELGATVCTPRQPSCLTCPVGAFCQTRLRGDDPHGRPFKSRKPTVSNLSFQCLLAVHQDQFLLARRADEGLMASMWELPAQISNQARPWQTLTETPLVPSGFLQPITHRFTHLHARYLVEVARAEHPFDFQLVGKAYSAFRWVTIAELGELPLTKVTSGLLTQIQSIISGDSLCATATCALPGMQATP
jgi:A/G-specific adenine glycosylase